MGCVSDKHRPTQALSTPTRQVLRLVPLQQIDHYVEPQFFIMTTQYQYFQKNLQQEIKKRFPNLRVFQNMHELQEYKQDGKNNVLIIVCKDPNDANQIRRLSNFHTFGKIVIAHTFDQNIAQGVERNCKKQLGFRFIGAIKLSSDQIIALMEKELEDRFMYFCHADIGYINRLNILCDFFFRRPFIYEPVHFYNWAIRKQEGQEFIQKLQNMPDNQILGKFIVHNLFTDNKIMMQAVQLLKKSFNPEVIGHTVWFCYKLFTYITESYKNSKIRLIKEDKNIFTAWIALRQQQIANLQKQYHFMYRGFLIASTNQQNPPKCNPHQRIFKLYINMPNDLQQYEPIVDTGFYFQQDKIIFNLQSMFSIDGFDSFARTLDVTYCRVGHQYNQRKNNSRYHKEHQLGDVIMLKTYDYYWIYKQYVHNQLDVLFALQFYQTYKRSVFEELNVIVQRLKITVSGDRNSIVSTANSVGPSHYPSKALLQKIGDCETQFRNYQSAAQNYEAVVPIERRLAKKLQFYQQTQGHRAQFVDTIQQLRQYQQQNNRSLGGFLGEMIGIYKAEFLNRSGKSDEAREIFDKALSNVQKLFKEKYVQKKKIYGQSYGLLPLYSLIYQLKLQAISQNDDLVHYITVKQQYEQKAVYHDGLHIFILSEA